MQNAEKETRSLQPRTAGWLLAANCLGILAVAVFFRAWKLDHLPGVNGDEAWMGVQALAWLNGEPFSWQTPTGNPLNIFFFLPMAAVHAIFSPSVAALRLPALASGVLALVVNYLLCNRLFGQRLAIVSTLLLAVLPLNIAYSRFGWDTSQSLLFTLPVIYFPLLAASDPARRLRWLLLSFSSLAAAIVVHPTNVFTAPLVFMAAVYSYRRPLLDFLRRGSRIRRSAMVMAALSVLAGVAGLLHTWVGLAANRLFTPGLGGDFFRGYVDLLSGTTVFRYIAGSQVENHDPGLIVYRVLAGLVVGAAIYGLVRVIRDHRPSVESLLVAGWVLSTIGFFLVAGRDSIAPGRERYSICLIAPAALLLARGLVWWLESPAGRQQKISTWACVALAWLSLLGFYGNYFAHIEQTGGQSHWTFRTAAVEPKLAALGRVVAGERLFSTTTREEPALIVTSEWWSYWPVAYLAGGKENVDVIFNESPREHAADRFNSGNRRPVWYVEFTRSGHAAEIERALEESGYRAMKSDVRDFTGRPLLKILRPLP